MWLDFAMNELEPPIGAIMLQLNGKMQENKTVSKTARNDLKNKLKILDNVLNEQKYIIKDRFTFADVSIVCDLWSVFEKIFTPKDRDEFKNLSNYFDNCINMVFLNVFLQPEFSAVLGKINYFVPQNQLKKKQTKAKDDIPKVPEINDHTYLPSNTSLMNYDENGYNNNVGKLSGKLLYNYTRKRVYINQIFHNSI